VRDFIVKRQEIPTLEGVLFADGTVVIHYLPPVNATLILASWDQVQVLLRDDEQVIWLNDLTRGYEVA
jgi:hypothetical protein